MMKVLYLTPWPPSLNNGGERHCYSNLLSLCLLKDVSIDYIGPLFDLSIFGDNNAFGKIVARSFTFSDKCKTAIHNAATSLSVLFSEYYNSNDLSHYDLIFIESTRCGFIFKHLPVNSKTICCIHNVEYDFAHYNRSNLLTKINIKRSEQYSLVKSKKLLFMHESDKLRMQHVYGGILDHANYEYHPVCSFSPSRTILPMADRNNNIVFSGSLDCRYNEVGIIEFVNSCWGQLRDIGYTLLIAGRNPASKLYKAINRFDNIEIIANPSSMEDILRDSKLMILPDLSGTGMKLRVAEAMSLGLPIVGTKSGFKGYEDVNKYGFETSNIKEMSKIARKMLVDDSANLVHLSSAAIDVWLSKYSFESFKNRIHTVVERAMN